VRSEPRRVASAVGLATVALVILLAVRPLSTGTIVAAYVLVVAAVGTASLTRILAGEPDLRVSPFDKAVAESPYEPTRPPELVRVERELTLGTSNAGHLHSRLVPLLRDVALARTGGTLTRERLGDETWELLRPDRQAPADRHAPGASLRDIGRVVARLEEL
jgi:hypothetical protein